MNKGPMYLLWIFLGVTIWDVGAKAQTQGINFQASLRDPRGEYISADGVDVTLQILDPVSECVLREEIHTATSIRDGYLNLVVGSSAAIVPAASNPNPALTLSQALDNSTANVQGHGCTYQPAAQDIRKLRLKMEIPRANSPDTDLIVADFNIRAVAYAMHARTLNGKTESDFVHLNPAKNVTQNHLESIFARYTTLDGLLNNANSNGSALGVNITGHAATATTATVANTIAGGVNALLPPQAGQAGKYLTTDGTNIYWENPPLFTGTISQLGLQLPTSVFENGPDLTANGALSATLKNQAAHTVLAGPASGVDAVPTFRQLTTDDIAGFSAAVSSSVDSRIDALKNIPGGIAALDTDGRIPAALLPSSTGFTGGVQTPELSLSSGGQRGTGTTNSGGERKRSGFNVDHLCPEPRHLKQCDLYGADGSLHRDGKPASHGRKYRSEPEEPKSTPRFRRPGRGGGCAFV